MHLRDMLKYYQSSVVYFNGFRVGANTRAPNRLTDHYCPQRGKTFRRESVAYQLFLLVWSMEAHKVNKRKITFRLRPPNPLMLSIEP